MLKVSETNSRKLEGVVLIKSTQWRIHRIEESVEQLNFMKDESGDLSSMDT